MEPNDEEAPDTRTRLLEAAFHVFAEKGYHATSFREVCGLAKANNAAINYHFRDKQHLYLEVLQRALTHFPDPFPLSGPGTQAPPEDQLRAFVRNVLTGLLGGGEGSALSRIMSHEMMRPTPVIGEVVERVILPIHRRLEAIVGELLGERPDSQLVGDCAHSVIAQCLHYDFSRSVMPRISPYSNFDALAIEHLAGHISEFSICALHSLKSRRSATDPPTEPPRSKKARRHDR